MINKAIILLAFCAVLSCSDKKNSEESLSESKIEAAPTKSAAMLMIDEEVKKIKMNPLESYEYCNSKNSINSLSNLATTEQEKQYVESEQNRLLEILRRYLDDITEKAAADYIIDQEIHDVAFHPMWEAWRGWNIVTTDKEKTSVSNNDGVYTKTITYRYTIKKSGGLFGSDKFVSKRAKGTAKFILRCNGESPVSYSGKILDN